MGIRNVLVATDLSEASDAVVAAAGAIAAHTGAVLHLVHAFEFELMPYVPEVREPTLYELRHRNAEEQLKAQAERVVPARVQPANRLLLSDRPHRAIIEVAEDVDPDLIVIGPHREAPIGDRVLGSTADRVLRTAAVPCLVMRGDLDLPLERILAPIDLSDAADSALDAAIEFARELGREDSDERALVAFHIVPTAFEVGGMDFDREIVEPEVRRAVEGAAARAGVAPETIRIDTRWGDDPADAIRRAIERERAGLVVIGTHGHGRLRRALIGSVAQAVARSSPVPVLLVPPNP